MGHGPPVPLVVVSNVEIILYTYNLLGKELTTVIACI